MWLKPSSIPRYDLRCLTKRSKGRWKTVALKKRPIWLRLEKLRGKWPERQLTASEAKFRMELWLPNMVTLRKKYLDCGFLKQGIRCRMKTPAGRPNRLSRWSALWEKKTLCCSWFRAEDRHCLKSRWFLWQNLKTLRRSCCLAERISRRSIPSANGFRQ